MVFGAGIDDGGLGTINDPLERFTIDDPPPPPPPYPEYVRLNLDRPPTAIPHEGVDEIIHLMRVDGDLEQGFTYTVQRVLSGDYQHLEWWYHRNGGPGTFRLLSRDRNILADFADRTAYAWEIWVRIRLPNESTYQTWYRGEIKSVDVEQSSQEVMVDVRGVGYIDQLQRLYLSRQFPAGLTVRQLMETIMEEYVYDQTRIKRADEDDPTNLGYTDSNYVLRSPLYFECTVYRALKFLAELQGDIEWGVDSEAQFYWKHELTVPGKAFFLDKDAQYTRGGAYTSAIINKVRMEGSFQGGRELLQVTKDITDPTDPIQHQEHSVVTEQPWVVGAMDAQHWADNILNIRRRMLHWRQIRWNNVDSRIESNHPHSALRQVLYRDANDSTAPISTYELDKIHYFKGGFHRGSEIREKARTKDSITPMPVTLTAEVWLGPAPRDLAENLNAMMDEIEALKGKWKQYRQPGDITNTGAFTPNTFGEIRFLRRDVTVPTDITRLQDVTNNKKEQWQPGHGEGILVHESGSGELVKVSPRRSFWPELPAVGLFTGEHATLYSDITNQIGVVWEWNGSEWVQLGSSASVDPVILTERVSKPAAPASDAQEVYAYQDGIYVQDGDGAEIGPIRDAPNHWRSVMAWQKAAGEQAMVLIGARTAVTTEGTEAAVDEINGQYLRYQTSSAPGSDAGWLTDTFSKISRRNRPIFDCVIELDLDIADARIWAAMTSADLMGATAPGAVSVMGFRCDKSAGETTWQAVVADGSGSNTAYDTGITVAIDTKYRLRADAHRESGKIFFYINGMLVATASGSDFLPSIDTLMGAQSEIRKVLGTGTVKQIKIQKLAVEYNG